MRDKLLTRFDPLRLAIVGAGPCGLALALQACKALPHAHITVFDARPADKDVSLDPRTLALSLGSIQVMQSLGLWHILQERGQTTAIAQVHVSQQQPSLLWPSNQDPWVTILAQEQGVEQLGAVVSYGSLVSVMQQAWLQEVSLQPHRLTMCFGTPVRGFKQVRTPQVCGVEIDADIVQTMDLAIVAEGGVFAGQPDLLWPEGISKDYGQTAWVGQVLLSPTAKPNVAYERFTPNGPAALLPLTDGAVIEGGPTGRRAALVWCVPNGSQDPISELSSAQRLALLNTVFPSDVGHIQQLSALKSFPLGLNAHWRLVEKGPLVRIGNAAQTLHPVAGQGLNLGLRDVHALLHALSNQPLGAALRQFERDRQPDRLALLAITDLLARGFVKSAPILATLRGFGLGMMQSLPFAKRALAHQMMFGHR